ncbi:MAG: L-alanine-DL-glutamate epimerase (EC, partial [uncultured Rubrobacteraceae bacterium]
ADEGAEVDGAHETRLRHRALLGRHLRACGPGGRGGRVYRQGRGRALRPLRPGRGGRRRDAGERRGGGPVGRRGHAPPEHRAAPGRARRAGQRPPRPRRQEARGAGLPDARARQAGANLRVHAGHSRQGDDRRGRGEATGVPDPEGQARRLGRRRDAAGGAWGIGRGALGGRERGVLDRRGGGACARAAGDGRNDRAARPRLRRPRGAAGGHRGRPSGTGDRRRGGRGCPRRAEARRLRLRGQRQARQVRWYQGGAGDGPRRPRPRDEAHARLHGRDLARHRGGGPHLGPLRLLGPRRRDAPRGRPFLRPRLRRRSHTPPRRPRSRGGAAV